MGFVPMQSAVLRAAAVEHAAYLRWMQDQMHAAFAIPSELLREPKSIKERVPRSLTVVRRRLCLDD